MPTRHPLRCRIGIAALCAVLVLSWTTRAYAADPALGSQAFKEATVSNETIQLLTVATGASVMVFYFVTGGGNSRVVTTVTDDQSNTYAQVEQSAACASARCVQAWVSHNVTGSATLTITVDQSSTFVAYWILATEVNCDPTCTTDVESNFQNTTVTTHPASADTTVIDTAAAVFVVAAYSSNGTLDTETAATNWTALDTSIVDANLIMAQYRSSTGGLTNERGNMVSGNARSTDAVIVSIKNTAAAITPKKLMLLGVG